MVAVDTSKTLVPIYQIIYCYMLEQHYLLSFVFMGGAHFGPIQHLKEDILVLQTVDSGTVSDV